MIMPISMKNEKTSEALVHQLIHKWANLLLTVHHNFPVILAICLQPVLPQFYFYFNIIYNTLVGSFPVPDGFLKNWRKLFFF